MTTAPTPSDLYTGNPLVHRDRRLRGAASPWVRSFACDDMRVLIVPRRRLQGFEDSLEFRVFVLY